MENDNRDSSAGPAERLNYFNYFTEVEEEFVRRRGKPLLISPMDWALVESWKNAGIPLHIVLRAINEAFDAYDARAPKYRKVNSIFYCQQQVESTFADYRLAQVGGEPPSSGSEDGEETNGARSTDEHEAFPKTSSLHSWLDATMSFEPPRRGRRIRAEVRLRMRSAGLAPG